MEWTSRDPKKAVESLKLVSHGRGRQEDAQSKDPPEIDAKGAQQAMALVEIEEPTTVVIVASKSLLEEVAKSALQEVVNLQENNGRQQEAPRAKFFACDRSTRHVILPLVQLNCYSSQNSYGGEQ